MRSRRTSSCSLWPAVLDAMSFALAVMRRPERAAAERLLEMADRRHRDRIDHLLMKLRVAFGRGPAILCQQT